MVKPVLIIGNRNYSSWSLRAWLTLSKAEINFDTIRIPLFVDGYDKEIAKYSSAGKVPIYRDGGLTIWDSLAIAEYLAEGLPSLWPANPARRANARSISAEMHSGFAAIRSAMPMNCRATNKKAKITPDVAAEINRVQQLIEECRSSHSNEGPWLFGSFSIADAMYVPVISRFVTYGVELDPAVCEYTETAMNDPKVAQWYGAAKEEPEVIEMAEENYA